MSSFSSVVRKPGQKITPKTAPRRTLQRQSARPTAPPSLTPESHAPSPANEGSEDRAQGQDDAHASTILESTELPDNIESADAFLPTPGTAETTTTLTPDPPLAGQDISNSVEVFAPISANESLTIIHPTQRKASAARSNAVPTVSASASTRARRRDTNEPTPAPSEGSIQEVEVEIQRDATNTFAPQHSRKRRKVSHTGQDACPARLSTTPPFSESTASILRRSAERRRSESRTSDALLQDATSQAAAVSELAQSIENRARSLSARSARTSIALTDDEGTVSTKKASKKRKKRVRTIEEIAQQVVDDAVKGGRRHSRLSTPENAEEIQIDPKEVSMGELTRDTKVGKKSETEKKMNENWAEIQQRRKEEVTRRREAAGQGRHGRQNMATNLDVAVDDPHVPQQIIVNGQIVVAAESREVAFGAGVEQAVIEDADVALEDDRIYKYVNQGTVGKYAGLRRGTRWDDEKTELFYKGLRWFGTDFAMTANFFPDIDRRQVKLKYTIEMRANPRRVRECVAAKEPVNMEEYMSMTEQEFIDPGALQAELDAQEKRLRDEDEQRREREGYIKDPADIALPTTEVDDNDEEMAEHGDDDNDAQRSQAARRERISAVAEQVVNSVGAPKKRTAQQQRKARESVSVRGRQRKKSRIPMEGIEERIGPIDEVG